MDKELRLALLNKEKAELFMNNLERLFSDKAINDASYKMLKSEYSASLQLAQSKVMQIKQELNKRLALKTRELDIYKQELANLDARFKVGQFSADEFIKLSRKPERKIALLEEQVSHLNLLIGAQHSSEIAAPETTGLGSFFAPRHKPAPAPIVISSTPEPPPPPPSPLPPQVEEPAAATPPPKPYDPTTVSDLMILPDRVLPGSTVGIIATIKNPGVDTVRHRTELRINDRLEAVNEMILNPGQSEELTFMTVASQPGEYAISVDSASGILRVISSL